MNTTERKLLELLEEEIAVYEALRRVKDRERSALIDFSPADLNRCNAEQEALILKAERLEEERREAVYQIVEGSEEAGREPSLREVLPKLGEDVRRRAIDLARRLSSVCVDLGNVQAGHSRLISSSHKYLRDFIETLLRRAQSPEPAYAPRGVFAPRRELEPGLLDRKA